MRSDLNDDELTTNEGPSSKDDVADKRRDGFQKIEKEGGYVMAMTALLLIPMMIFTAFATDVGAWYVKGQEIQRASDAAALAAVVWMPNETKAAEVALAVAARNGFVDNGPPDDLTDFDDPNAPLPQVKVTKLGSQRIRVDIRAEGDLYFGTVIDGFQNPRIERFAAAEYILPVPMGNPTSALGTGSDTAYGTPDNFFLNSNGNCRRRRDGDLISSTHSLHCSDQNGSNGEVNPMHDPNGHAFIIDVPADPTDPTGLTPAGNYEVQVRIACYKQTRPGMIMTLFGPDDTPLDDFDNEIPAELINQQQYDQQGCGSSGGAGTNDNGDWRTIAPLSEAGRHVLRALHPVAPANANNNIWEDQSYYSLRIVPLGAGDSSSWGCSRITNPVVSTMPLCPNISAREWMTVVTESDMLPSGAQSAELYLAEVPAVHVGKTLEITMFDAADGLDFVQVIDPHGNAVALNWQSVDVSDLAYGQSGGNDLDTFMTDRVAPVPNETCGTPWGTTEFCLRDPWPNHYSSQSGTNRQWMQDRTVRMEVDLAGYTCNTAAVPENCWWKVRYVDDNGSIGEVTTWSVRIVGDPVRLVE